MVALMSGCFVQRGEPAIADPYSRACAVIAGGADLVLELPFPYASSSSEFFGAAGVDILSRLSVDELWFGSECGDIKLLQKAAEIAASEAFIKKYAVESEKKQGTAEAFFDCLNTFLDTNVKFSSNDILGISYLCAMKKLQSEMIPVTRKREGSAYRDDVLRAKEHPSATELRRLLLFNDLAACRGRLLPQTADALQEAGEQGTAMATLALAERAILAHLRMQTSEEIEQVAELEGGLGNRLLHASEKASSLEELLKLAATKKYTQARIQRGILFSMVGVGAEDLRTSPAYVRVLAANPTGCSFLAKNRKTARIPTVTRQAELPNDAAAQRQETLHRRAVGLYTLCLPQPTSIEMLMKKNPKIIKDTDDFEITHRF